MVQIANSKQNFQLKCQNDLTYSVESRAFIMSGNFDVLLVCTVYTKTFLSTWIYTQIKSAWFDNWSWWSELAPWLRTESQIWIELIDSEMKCKWK